MLFDLRSRGRRRTVQAVYLGLAVLMGGGLILFGVGTGSGLGGLLNAFTGNGSPTTRGAQISAVRSAEKAAIKTTQKDPSNATCVGRPADRPGYQNASSVGFNSNTNTYSAAGKQELTKATEAWQRYLALTKNPTNNLSIVAANAYATLGDYASEANAWDYATQADPTSPKSFECLAISSYAAKQNRTGDLAAAKVASMVPKSTRKTLLQQINTAKTNPALAQTC